MSPHQPNSGLHMRTRRRASQQATPPSSDVASSSPTQVGSSRPSTPEQPTKSASDGSSSLSSRPSTIEMTLEGLSARKPLRSSLQTRQQSPAPRTSIKRNAKLLGEDSPPSKHAARWSSEQTSRFKDGAQLLTPSTLRTTRSITARADKPRKRMNPQPMWSSRKRKADEDLEGSDEAVPSPVQRRPVPKLRTEQKANQGDHLCTTMEPLTRMPNERHSSPKPTRMKRGALVCDPDYKDTTSWPSYDSENPIYFGADAMTQYHAGSQDASSATGSPRRNGRGGGRGGRGRGSGFSNGAGRGKGRPRGGGRAGRGGGDSPERKRVLSPDSKAELLLLKERQQQLKRFFKIVGAQQYEILDQLAARDVTKLVRKPKAHEQVPEYNQVFSELVEEMKVAINLAKKRKDIETQHENDRYERDLEVIESVFKKHVQHAQMEHVRGAQGDIILLRHAHDAANDDTRTETGSEIDYFPQYHPSPEAGARVRGYDSNAVIDEKAFKLPRSSYEDEARREVIDDDILAPIARDLIEQNKRHSEEEARQQTQTMAALSEEAGRQLKEMKGSRLARPSQRERDQNAYALSALADMSEVMAQRYRFQPYQYMPLGSGEQFPRNALNYGPLPGTSTQSAPRPSPATTNASHQPPRRVQPPAPSPRVRHGQGVPGQQQFVFQTPQQIFPQSAPPGQAHMVQQQPRIPVTFVNQTISSRKQSAANGGGKGPRMLLPKMA